ncbi:MAG: two-component sensor histidine kinase, partial [Ignavibacteriales bacterium]|nr:two-component sensor histidine kinase [Ignavibacteriales bacterium]
ISGKIGIVRVGLKESFIRSDVQKTINVFWVMVAVFLLFGIFGALVFAVFINRPIKEIQNAVDNIDLTHIGSKQLPLIVIRKRLFNKIPMIFRAEDEIDILAEKFNDMIKRLDTAYQELQRTQTNLIQSEKLATVGTLTAGLAHEINNPVAGLQNCIRRISNDPKNLEQNKKYLVMMENAIDRIERIVNSFLDYTRKQETTFSNLYLESIIENTLILLGHRLEVSRVTISKNFHPSLPQIKGNKNQLEQVILNLVINSLDSIEERISKDNGTARKIDFSAKLYDKNIILKVIDSGNGIPADVLDKVFDPFFTTKPPGKGTGLGLSVVYNIIKTHNGKIMFESKENSGTSVSITLPVA